MAVTGRLAFVTGAGSGIGRATCQILAREGATIIATDKNITDVEKTITSINKSENSHTGMALDVAEPEAGTFFVVQTFANAIIDHGITNASIINIGSIVGKYGNIGQVNYSASKAGVELLTKTASKELGKKGIRVNAVLPGMILTPMLQAVPDKVKEKFKLSTPLGRFGTPDEVAEVITFLASDKSSYITGASIEITGGF
ncbi:hypothetical protein NQ318_017354 [Aromia moschata]|uniref:Estradiol 17-beta-dehydrogenase 8 n=1 Tax=Aromia moschata TaxID=1265417 RepID=A0AAV8Z2E3_9CUCU|nr:hypothetical protein NQ318_017354 [Aromia moschata]